jgi:hypothetical protein
LTGRHLELDALPNGEGTHKEKQAGTAAMAMRNFRRGRMTRTFDEFLVSRRPITPLQFWGLLILGGGLIVGEMCMAFLMLSQLPWATLDMFDFGAILIIVGIGASIFWLGALLIKRAFWNMVHDK